MPQRQGSERRASAPVEANTPVKEGAVKKLPLTEKVKTFLGKVGQDTLDAVHELVEVVVQDSEGNKNNVAFVVFSDKVQEDTVNEEVNKEHIKRCLFEYHMSTDEVKKGGKVLLFSVTPPDTADGVHVLSIQEMPLHN